MEIVVEDTFFYNTFAKLTLLSATSLQIQNVVFRQNSYVLGQYGGNNSIVLAGAPLIRKKCINLSVEGEIDGSLGSQHVRLTHLTESLAGSQTVFEFDFSKRMLLPWIDTFIYSVLQTGNLLPELTHSASLVNGTAVRVVLSQKAQVMVTVDVGQCS